MSRQGRYKDVAQNLKVKEVKIAEDKRFVICFNPEAAERDAAVRARMTARLEAVISGSDQLCWLALLLARISENATGQTWPDLRRELSRIHIGTFTGPPAPFSSAPSSPNPSGTSSKP